MLDRALVVNPIKNVSTGEPFNEMMTALVFLFLGRSIFKKRETQKGRQTQSKWERKPGLFSAHISAEMNVNLGWVCQANQLSSLELGINL